MKNQIVEVVSKLAKDGSKFPRRLATVLFDMVIKGEMLTTHDVFKRVNAMAVHGHYQLTAVRAVLHHVAKSGLIGTSKPAGGSRRWHAIGVEVSDGDVFFSEPGELKDLGDEVKVIQPGIMMPLAPDLDGLSNDKLDPLVKQIHKQMHGFAHDVGLTPPGKKPKGAPSKALLKGLKPAKPAGEGEAPSAGSAGLFKSMKNLGKK